MDNHCPNCNASSFFAIEGIDTDLCIVCYRESIPPEKRRVAWRCNGCWAQMSWLHQEVIINDKPFCDQECYDNKQKLIAELR